jgi:hypothetical protein
VASEYNRDKDGDYVVNTSQPELKTPTAFDKALEWGLVVAVGLSVFNLPADIIKYREGDGSLLPLIGTSSLVFYYGAHKWLQRSAKLEALRAASADVSVAKTVREDEVDELQARLGHIAQNKTLPKP